MAPSLKLDQMIGFSLYGYIHDQGCAEWTRGRKHRPGQNQPVSMSITQPQQW